jgi:integrase
MTACPIAGKSDRDAIPVDDALKILAAVADQRDGSKWVAALLQGMRQGERLGLTWPLVDLEADVPTFDISWQLQPLPYKVKRDRTSGFRVPDGYEARQLEGRMHLVRPRPRAASGSSRWCRGWSPACLLGGRSLPRHRTVWSGRAPTGAR